MASHRIARERIPSSVEPLLRETNYDDLDELGSLIVVYSSIKAYRVVFFVCILFPLVFVFVRNEPP